MFSILIFGLLVIIAVSLVRNSRAHQAKVALREERAEAKRVERIAQETQILEGVSAIRQMSRDKIIRDRLVQGQDESYTDYAHRTFRERRSF